MIINHFTTCKGDVFMKSLHYPVLSLNLGKPQTLEYDGKKLKPAL